MCVCVTQGAFYTHVRCQTTLSPYGVRDFPVVAPYTNSVAQTDLGAKLAAAEWMTKDVVFSPDLSLSVSLPGELDQLRLLTHVT